MPLRRVSPAASRIYAMDVAPLLKARMLRELATWYRESAPRAGSPAIWEARLLTAEDLETEADCIETQNGQSTNGALGERNQAMNPLVNEPVSVNGKAAVQSFSRLPIELLANVLARLGLLRHDADYHLLRAAMVIIFFFFGYQKWFPYEVERLTPFISNGPLIFWLYPTFGARGATLFLGASEWTFGTMLLLGFWSKAAGILGALGSTGTFIATVTIIPFMPQGWDVGAGGFPAMTGNVPFLMKDVVLLAVSLYLLKQDVQRSLLASTIAEPVRS